MPETDRPGALNEACEHPVANHRHGTLVCHNMDLCRCEECRGANRRYEQHRVSWASEFPWRPQPLVDARPVVDHVTALMDQGMGLKRIGKVAGVAPSAIGNVVYGRGGANARAATKMRRKTAEKVLAVELDLADGAKVDGTEARAIIDELVARGWTGPQAKSLQVGRSNGVYQGGVFAGTLRALRRLLSEPVPLRTHNPTGKTYRPNPGYKAKFIPPTTPGVPIDPETLKEWDRVRLWEAVRRSIAEHGHREFIGGERAGALS